MKKTVLTLALVASTFAALAQGRLSIANDSLRLFEIGASNKGDPAGPIIDGALPSGNVILLALYAGTTSGSMTLQTSYALTGANYLAPGRGATKPLTLVGVPGGVQQFFNIVLVNVGAVLPNSIDGALYGRNQTDAFSSSALAAFSANYYGSSGLFQFTPSTSAISAPPINGPGTTWALGSMYITGVPIPEPSSMVLAGLGAASLLLFRRRK
jgi:hypothetical protein